jgi:hypothetical protein
MIATLESISPVHIGSGIAISPLEYWVQDVFVRLNMDALFADERFAEHSNSFIRAAGKHRYIGDLLPEELLCDHCRYWVPFAPQAGAHLAANRVDVHEFVKTSGRVFVPGSSIKGAVLSAAVHQVLCELYPKAAYRSKIEDLLRNPNGRHAMGELLDMVFGRFLKTPKDKTRSRVDSWLRVGDTGLAAPDRALHIVKTEVRGAKTGQNPPILYETLSAGKRFAFEIQAAPDLRWDIIDLLKIADRFYRMVWEKTMKSTVPGTGYLLRLGQGSSAYATSLLIFAEQHHIGPGIYRFFPPRTRKTAEGDAAMGWVLVDIQSDGARPSVRNAGSAMAPMPMPKVGIVPTRGKPTGSTAGRMMIKKARKRSAPVVLQRDSKAAGLLKQIEIIQAGDAFALERIVKAMDELDDENAQRTVAEALKKKLVATGTWKKHRLRPDIEFYLPHD